MKKQFCLLAGATALLFSLTGCESQQADAAALYIAPGSAFEEQVADDLTIALTQRETPLLLPQEGEGYAELIEARPGVLVAKAADQTQADEIIRLAKKENVPVLFYGTAPSAKAMAGYDNCWFVGFDPRLEGETAGALLAQSYQDGAVADKNADLLLDTVLLQSSADPAPSVVFTEITARSIEDTGLFLTILGTYGQDSEPAQAAQAAYDAHGATVEAYLCADDALALAAVSCLNAQKTYFVPEGESCAIVCAGGGPDALEAVAAGQITGIAFRDPGTVAGALEAMCSNALARVHITEGTSFRLEKDRTLYLAVTPVTVENITEALAAYPAA